MSTNTRGKQDLLAVLEGEELLSRRCSRSSLRNKVLLRLIGESCRLLPDCGLQMCGAGVAVGLQGVGRCHSWSVCRRLAASGRQDRQRVLFSLSGACMASPGHSRRGYSVAVLGKMASLLQQGPNSPGESLRMERRGSIALSKWFASLELTVLRGSFSVFNQVQSIWEPCFSSRNCLLHAYMGHAGRAPC